MAVNTTIQVVMPQMGESVTEGTVLSWFKQEGDEVMVRTPAGARTFEIRQLRTLHDDLEANSEG